MSERHNGAKNRSIAKQVLFRTDRAICGANQVPATVYEDFGGDEHEAVKIAEGRIKVAAGAGMRVAGKGLATYGLSKDASPALFGIGAVIAVAGGMVQNHAANENGSRWRMFLEGKIGALGPHKRALDAALINAGVSSEEVDNISNLPNDMYLAELGYSNVERIGHALTPIVSGAAIAGYADNIVDYATAAAVTGLGLASFPLGERFYNESNVVRAAELRAGRSARLTSYVRKALDKHIGMTDSLKLLSYSPEILFAAMYSFANTGNVLPALYGIRQGLDGFNGLLTTQRTRESTSRTTEIATHLIDAMTNKPFITTPQRWQEHVDEAGITDVDEPPFKNGIMIRNFTAQIPTGERTSLAPISLNVEANSAAVLRAESGTGKSATLMGAMHLLEHEGSIHIVKDGQAEDIHRLNGPEEVAKKILLITEEGINGNDRIVDLFKSYFQHAHMDEFEKQLQRHEPLLVELAWKVADNLLEQEIKKIEKSERAVFPSRMLNALKYIRDTRNGWVNEQLETQGGNIANHGLMPGRVFSTLSSGERRRMLVAVADVAVKTLEPAAVILDEPLAHLDSKNRQHQLQVLKRMQEGENPVALIIVSHENVEELKEGLNNCQVAYLERVSIE